jgi:hypothetical protein
VILDVIKTQKRKREKEKKNMDYVGKKNYTTSLSDFGPHDK